MRFSQDVIRLICLFYLCVCVRLDVCVCVCVYDNASPRNIILTIKSGDLCHNHNYRGSEVGQTLDRTKNRRTGRGASTSWQPRQLHELPAHWRAQLSVTTLYGRTLPL